MTHLELMRELEQMEQALEHDSRRTHRALRAIKLSLDNILSRLVGMVKTERGEGPER